MRRVLISAHRYSHNSEDLTFKFYSDSGLSIFNNNSNEYLLPGDLSNEAYSYYALKRIEYISKHILQAKEDEECITV